MSIQISRTAILLEQAMDYRSIRQDMIASNIANVDTPNYKPRDVRFEDALAAQKDIILHRNDAKLQMAQTNDSHLAPSKESSSIKATTYFRDGHMARNDGNSVDLDIETTEMSKNSIMFNALTQAMKKDMKQFMSVIEASQKIN